jgi:hypothetical protein
MSVMRYDGRRRIAGRSFRKEPMFSGQQRFTRFQAGNNLRGRQFDPRNPFADCCNFASAIGQWHDADLRRTATASFEPSGRGV